MSFVLQGKLPRYINLTATAAIQNTKMQNDQIILHCVIAC